MKLSLIVYLAIPLMVGASDNPPSGRSSTHSAPKPTPKPKSKKMGAIVLNNASDVEICHVHIYRNNKRITRRRRLKNPIPSSTRRWFSYRMRPAATTLVEVRSCDGLWSAARRFRRLRGRFEIAIVGATATRTPKSEPGATLSTRMRLQRTDVCPPRKDGRLSLSCAAVAPKPKSKLDGLLEPM